MSTCSIEIVREIFGTKMRCLRIKHGITQAALGAVVGVSQHAIGAYEEGNSFPSVESLLRMANYFGCTTDYLLDREVTK